MSGWETTIATGNREVDQRTVEQHRQAAAAQGLSFDARPLPTGGFHVRAWPAPMGGQPMGGPPMGGYPQQGPGGPPMGGYPQQQAYGGPPMGGYPQQQAYGAPAYAAAGAGGGMVFSTSSSGGSVMVGSAAGAPPLTQDRVRYLRKVYGLLLASVVIAGLSGLAAVSLGPEMILPGTRVHAPMLVGILLSSRVMMYAAFGALFVATLIASAVSKVPVLNTIALFGVSALMGVELAPMVFVAQYLSGLGRTLTPAPVLGAFLVTAAVFAGATSYVFITKKDFSYLGATLSMGFWVVFIGCFVAVFISSEVFTLAICSVGAIVAGGMLLLQTSRIFRSSQMDDAVGDCLALLVQLRNLFVFLLRIFMSNSRR